MGGTLLSASSYGPHWRTLRRVAAVQLLSAQRVGCMSDVISGEVRAMVRRLHRSAGTSPRIQLKRRLFELSFGVLMETIAHTKATRPEADADDADTDMSVAAQEFSKVLDDINVHLEPTNLWDYLPVTQWFDLFGRARNKVMAAVGTSYRDLFLQRLIDAERQNLDDGGGGGEGEKKSMIAVLITLQKKEPQVYTDSMIMGLCVTLFTAGTGTTSATIEWAMSLLLNHPAALKKAHASGPPALSEPRICLASPISIVSSARLSGSTLQPPLLLPHQSSAECEIGGHKIPSGTMLTVNAYDIHRDPAIWEDPAEFKPERFEEGKAEGLFMIPFGMGRRKCPGEAMALRTVGLALGALIQCIDWEPVNGLEAAMTEEVSRFVLHMAVPFEAICKPRTAMCDVLYKL